MGTLMIRCPNTGREISTGIDTESRSFNQIPNVEARTLCPLCGEEHVWTKREARLAHLIAPQLSMPARRRATDQPFRRS